MKRFHFNLAAVLTLRQRAEQQALEGYAQSLLARQRAFERLEALRQELSAAWAKLREQLGAGCSSGELDHLRGYSRSLEEERLSREAALQQAEVEMNRALQLMLSARQQREAVDRFRSARQTEHDRAMTREEQKFLDELASQRAANPVLRQAA